MLSIFFAVLTSLSNGTASVLQRRAAATVDPRKALHASLIGALLRRRVWLAGIGLVIVAAACQAIALATGPISIVQPIFVIELPATLILGSFVFHRRLPRSAWLGVAAVTGGLAVALASAAPSGGTAGVPWLRWPPALIGTGGAIVLLVTTGLRARGEFRAAAFGLAAAFGYALTAALLKDATAQRHGGVGELFAAWQLYATAAVGVTSLFLLQNALQAGSLAASQPMLTLGDALLSTAFGVVLFSEHVRLGWWLVPELFGIGAIGVGCVLLARHLPTGTPKPASTAAAESVRPAS
ncbi:DMT family transporter [Yinghuangia sp. ASG 101]|uniref:DMT family transporter n=1 Tax=Yinghuangia sp. ASG 101 TaxID=2896848 RepID=UPI001E5BD39B|nr:DMT family transporter [Yinghuangia sp. ASG 101]UGQ12354.1 DMT family transporter [Yinghuangia sp. ASG 101]